MRIEQGGRLAFGFVALRLQRARTPIFHGARICLHDGADS